MTAPLRRVFVRRPGDVDRWREYGWRCAPDPVRLVEEHERFCELLAGVGADVVVGEPLDSSLDAVYVHDPATVTDAGAVLLRPGKEARRAEVDAIERDLHAAGVTVLARVEEPATVEGGDMLWLDDESIVVGRGYRTNDAGVDALRTAFPHADVVAVDLPHYHGRGEVMHLLSLISPLDDDLAVVYPPLMPVRLVELLESRGIELVHVPDEEFETVACNVLALGPRRALALDGNPETRRRLEAAGVDVVVYEGNELSCKGDGGPTCLTRPLVRGA
jgi:N-dimethylarginine dimethylaminohydrolase